MATNKQKGAAAGIAAALVIATPLIQKWEGVVHDPYKDVIGIKTVCVGHTGKDIENRRYTTPECEKLLEKDLETHTAPVVVCVPSLTDHPYQLAASASLAFNIGPSAFCRSSIARKFNAGQWVSGCNGFLAWDMAGGRHIVGLARRRADERRVCLTGLS